MLTDRILPPDEWPKLRGTDLGATSVHFDSSMATIMVVEDDGGAIVGCWAAIRLLHAEGVWIHPDHRGKGVVARRLWQRMKAVVHAAGATSVLTAATSPEIHALLDRQGAAPVPQEYVLCL